MINHNNDSHQLYNMVVLWNSLIAKQSRSLILFKSNQPHSSIGSDNGLAPTRQQAIIWTHAGWLKDAYMRHSASMS